MKHTITLIKGDGIGPEVSDATVRCVEAAGLRVKWEIAEAGEDAIKKYGTPLPESTLDSIRKNKVAIKGPITTPIGTGFRSVNVSLRKQLNLYACLRPCKHYEGVRSKYPGTDLVIVRENMEDLYAGIEFEMGSAGARKLIDFIAENEGSKIQSDSGISIKPISRTGTQRIAKFAFEYAQKYGRKKVTSVTKANIMKHTDGLFMRTAEEVSKGYPDVAYEHRLVDNMCMQLVQKPELYDVLLLPNLYGDILSDLCAGLVGGLGVAAGANIGDEYAVFEATHGSAPSYARKNKVNPTAMILSGVLMLRHIGEANAADRLENAVAAVIKQGRDVTYDMKPNRDDPTAAGTQEMADAIIRHL
ncbi:MAG: isocitrate/isopropylmalate dehydrogenase family protein [Candidatus Altiarchaeota archaeon]|nr:isocitrate/isopropylmalate dehydrogenase family protein [Candidatus Altiarchaeota archaeon]